MLHVDEQEFTWTLPFVAQRHGRRTIQVCETRQAGSAEHPVDGRTRVTEHRCEAVRTHLQAPAAGQDPADLGGRERSRASLRC